MKTLFLFIFSMFLVGSSVINGQTNSSDPINDWVSNYKYYIVVNQSSDDLSLTIGGGNCFVFGDCESNTCEARIQCGCDETPKCDCGWFRCKCDCEKKGAYAIGVTDDQYHFNLDLKELLSTFNSDEGQTVFQNFSGTLDALINGDYGSYLTFSENLEGNMTDLPSNEKEQLNNWLEEKGVEERVD